VVTTTVKEYLRSYGKVVKEMRKIENELNYLREEYDAIRSSSDNDGMPHGTSIGSPTESKAIKVVDLMNKNKEDYESMRKQRTERRDKVFRLIMMTEGLEQEILYSRYIQLKTFRVIAEELKISERHCARVHGNALQSLRKKISMS